MAKKSDNKSAIEKLKDIKTISLPTFISEGGFWLLKKIVIEQEQRINELELAVAKLTGCVEKDNEDEELVNHVPVTQKGTTCFTCKHQEVKAQHEPCLTCEKGHTNHEYKDESTTKPKYLVRPKDYSIFDLDESNGCYRLWSRKPMTYMDGTRPNAMKHFTFKNLTENYGFFPIVESEIEKYELKSDEHYKFLSWQNRSDGHGGVKGGTYEEYLKTLKRI